MSFLAVPVSVLLAGTVIIWLLNRKQRDIGKSWGTAIVSAVFLWGWTLFLQWQPERAFRLSMPQGSASVDFPIFFVLDKISWPYMMALAALLLILLLTAPSRIDPKTSPRIWSLYLVVELIGYVAVTSGGVWPIIFCWMFFDIIDLFSQFFQSDKRELGPTIMTSIGVRLIGTLLAATSLAMSIEYKDDGTMITGTGFISQSGAIALMVACSLRLGILPLHQPYSDMGSSHIGISSLLQMVSILTVLPILSRIQSFSLPSTLAIFLSLFVGFAALVGACGWLLAKDAASGSSYICMAITGMAFASALRSQQHALTAWGVSIVLTCTPVFLYQMRNRLMNVLPVISILLFSGLPYMPNAVGWFGLIIEPFSVMDLLFVVVPMLVMGGAFIHISRKSNSNIADLDPWMRSVYPLGFVIAIASHLLICMLNWQNAYSIGVWPASVAAFVGALIIWYSASRIPENSKAEGFAAWAQAGVQLFWKVTRKLLDLEWLFFALKYLHRLLNELIRYTTNILENQGGVVWEFFFLSVFAIIVFSGSLV